MLERIERLDELAHSLAKEAEARAEMEDDAGQVQGMSAMYGTRRLRH